MVSTELEYDFEQSVGYWLILTAQAYQKSLSELLTPHGLTFRQSQVLAWLALEGELSQVELAGRMMIEPATVVGVLDRMERDGLIQRAAVDGDRRRKCVRATPAAAKVWQKVAACARQTRQKAAEGMSPTQVDGLRRTLRLMLENLDAKYHGFNGAKPGRQINSGA